LRAILLRMFYTASKEKSLARFKFLDPRGKAQYKLPGTKLDSGIEGMSVLFKNQVCSPFFLDDLIKTIFHGLGGEINQSGLWFHFCRVLMLEGCVCGAGCARTTAC